MTPLPPRRPGLSGWLIALAAALPLAACGLVNEPLQFGGYQTPPPNPLVHNGPYDGAYAGNATLWVNPDLACLPGKPIDWFWVANNNVRFGGFSGPIQPDGSVQIYYADIWLQGRFDGPRFSGHIVSYGSDGTFLARQNACNYVLDMRRTG